MGDKRQAEGRQARARAPEDPGAQGHKGRGADAPGNRDQRERGPVGRPEGGLGLGLARLVGDCVCLRDKVPGTARATHPPTPCHDTRASTRPGRPTPATPRTDHS